MNWMTRFRLFRLEKRLERLEKDLDFLNLSVDLAKIADSPTRRVMIHAQDELHALPAKSVSGEKRVQLFAEITRIKKEMVLMQAKLEKPTKKRKKIGLLRRRR